MNLLTPVDGSTLLELLELRAALRQQGAAVAAALRDVGAETRCWNRHRRAQRIAGQPVPDELSRLWDDLQGRERELAGELQELRELQAAVSRSIERALETPRLAG